MKKQIILLMLFAFLSVNALSQVSFSHSIGSCVYSNSDVEGGGIMYSPRLNIVNFGDKSSVSIGTHLGIGFGGSVNSQTGARGALILDLPLMLEFNGGLACTPHAYDQDFGYFAGAGFGYCAMGGTDELRGYSGSSIGPVLNVGVVGRVFERPLGLRLSYLINVKNNGGGTLGIGVFWEFGDF